jgi:serine/threonine-protein kinase SRPK3
MSPEEIYKEFNFPELKRVIRFDKKSLPKGVPKHVIPPVWLGEDSDLIPLSEAEIILTDFGVSFQPSTTPRYWRESWGAGIRLPPEVYFLPRESLSFPSDIWALACAIWELISLCPLFDPLMRNPTADDVIEQHVDLLGKLPPEWWQRWDARSGVEGALMGSFEERFDEMQESRRSQETEEFSEEEMAALINMLKAMMAFKPGDRMTANQIIESKWMKEWALPELSRLRKGRRT